MGEVEEPETEEWMREIKHEEREGTGERWRQNRNENARKDDRRNTLVIHSILVLKGGNNTQTPKLCSFPQTHKTPHTASKEFLRYG